MTGAARVTPRIPVRAIGTQAKTGGMYGQDETEEHSSPQIIKDPL